MKRYHRRRTCSHTSARRSPTMVTLHDTRFVEVCLSLGGHFTTRPTRLSVDAGMASLFPRSRHTGDFNKNISHSKAQFETFLNNLLTASNRLQRVRSSGQSAIVCKSRATHRALITCNISSYVPRGTKGQLSY